MNLLHSTAKCCNIELGSFLFFFIFLLIFFLFVSFSFLSYFFSYRLVLSHLIFSCFNLTLFNPLLFYPPSHLNSCLIFSFRLTGDLCVLASSCLFFIILFHLSCIVFPSLLIFLNQISSVVFHPSVCTFTPVQICLYTLEKSTQDACHFKGYLANRIAPYTGVCLRGQIEPVSF